MKITRMYTDSLILIVGRIVEPALLITSNSLKLVLSDSIRVTVVLIGEVHT